MGTNYYALAPECESPCKHCDVETLIHIGKNLVMFEAHEASPWGPINDWSDWKRIFAAHSIVIRDEYGWEHDPREFVAEVEATVVSDRSRQYRWMRDQGYDLSRDYLDSHNFSWTRGEFS